MLTNIVDTATDAENFTTLVKAVQAADLVDTLSGSGPFTVFAPTDAAFAKLPSGALDSLLQNKEPLTSILTYHVVSGKYMTSDVKKLKSVTTVQGGSVKVEVHHLFHRGVKVDDVSNSSRHRVYKRCDPRNRFGIDA